MEKFTKMSEPVELINYTIYLTPSGVKGIQIIGHCYKRDYDWCVVSYIGIDLPLPEFILNYKLNKDSYVNELMESAKKYEEYTSDNEMLRTINKYYGGEYTYFMPFSEITPDTPYGNYIYIIGEN